MKKYYDSMVGLLEDNKICIKSELKKNDEIKMMVADDDFNELIMLIKKKDDSIILEVNNKASSIYKKILPSIIKLEHEDCIYYDNYIGTDESGKGDYFGPLVVAGFVSTKSIDMELIRLGVKDSKKLTDKWVLKIAEELKNRYYDRISIFSLEPEAYNDKYSILKLDGENLTSLLGFVHSMVINTLLKNSIYVDTLVIDKIQSMKYVDEIVDEHKIKIINTVHGEDNMAVAAASILARAEFINWLTKASKEIGIELCKGANDMVIINAVQIMKKLGKQELMKYAKLHFKTTRSVVERYNNEK